MDSSIFVTGTVSVADVTAAISAWASATAHLDVEGWVDLEEMLPGYPLTVNLYVPASESLDAITDQVARHLEATLGVQALTDQQVESTYLTAKATRCPPRMRG